MIAPTHDVVRHNIGRVLTSGELEEVRDGATVSAAGLFGGLVDVAHGFSTQTRAAELGDLVADIAGACFVYAAIVLKASFRRKP